VEHLFFFQNVMIICYFRSMNKVIVYIFFYIISILSLLLFYQLNTSNDLFSFLKKADNFRTDWGFGFYVIVGLVKLVSLIAGITIPIIVTTVLIKNKKNLK
jgi:hypothetical protein